MEPDHASLVLNYEDLGQQPLGVQSKDGYVSPTELVDAELAIFDEMTTSFKPSVFISQAVNI
jgi:hypothetical protein